MGTLWDDGWYVLPDGSAIFKGDARPCGTCGAWTFAVVETGRGCRVQCPACVRPREGDRAVGMLDRRTWQLTSNAERATR